MAPRRKAVASCQALSLLTLEKATANYIKQATEDFVLAENLLECSIKKVQAYLFHSTPRCLCSKVANSFINALTSWLKLSGSITSVTNDQVCAVPVFFVNNLLFSLNFSMECGTYHHARRKVLNTGGA